MAGEHYGELERVFGVSRQTCIMETGDGVWEMRGTGRGSGSDFLVTLGGRLAGGLYLRPSGRERTGDAFTLAVMEEKWLPLVTAFAVMAVSGISCRTAEQSGD